MKKSRLTIDNRINIQAGLEKGMSLSRMVDLVKKNRTTLYRELHCYSIEKQNGKTGCLFCKNRQSCEDNGVYIGMRTGINCKEFIKKQCLKLKKIPLCL